MGAVKNRQNWQQRFPLPGSQLRTELRLQKTLSKVGTAAKN
jgi:hypothetical protein